MLAVATSASNGIAMYAIRCVIMPSLSLTTPRKNRALVHPQCDGAESGLAAVRMSSRVDAADRNRCVLSDPVANNESGLRVGIRRLSGESERQVQLPGGEALEKLTQPPITSPV